MPKTTLTRRSTRSDPWRPDVMPAMLISTAAKLLSRIAESRLRDLGISTSQFPVFAALKDGEQRSQKELTRLAGIEQSSMAQLLARMERDGFVCRDPDPTDGRSFLFSLTASALALFAPAREVLCEGNREALAGFNKHDTDQLVALLQRLIANVSDSGNP